MSAYNPPSYFFNGITFNSSFYTSEQNQSLDYPVAQGNETLQGITVNGTATFNQQPITTATQPATNDNSNKIPTTAWVQSALTGGAISNAYLYPQKWISNLSRYYTVSSPLTMTNPTYTSQTISIRIPVPSTETGNSIYPQVVSLRLLVSTQIFGNYRDALIGNIFSCSSEVVIQYSRVQILNIMSFNNAAGNTSGTTTLSGMTSPSTNIPIRNPNTAPSGANEFVASFTPLTVTLQNRNTINLTFSQFTSNSGQLQSVWGITRSAEILSSSLSRYYNTANSNTWNVVTFPNINSTLVGDFAVGTQNLAAYFLPTSTNNY